MVRLPPLPVLSAPGAIPRIVHQFWLGPDSERAERVSGLWSEVLPGWDVRLWTEQSTKDSPLERWVEKVQQVSEDYRLQADLLRLVALSYYGGIYADSDAVPLQPLDDWIGARNGWIGSGPETEDSPTLINATFGAPAGHPFLARVMVLAQRALERGVTNPHWVAGPRQFRTAYTQVQDMDVDYRFVTTLEAKARAMVRGDVPIDLGWLREQYPTSPILHVVLR